MATERRFPMPVTVCAGGDMEESGLQVSADAEAGEGIVVMGDVISEVVDGAR